jgi:hypothetical protein
MLSSWASCTWRAAWRRGGRAAAPAIPPGVLPWPPPAWAAPGSRSAAAAASPARGRPGAWRRRACGRGLEASRRLLPAWRRRPRVCRMTGPPWTGSDLLHLRAGRLRPAACRAAGTRPAGRRLRPAACCRCRGTCGAHKCTQHVLHLDCQAIKELNLAECNTRRQKEPSSEHDGRHTTGR